jgi:hypothetical protein
MIDDCIGKVLVIKGLVADGSADSLNKAINAIDELREMLIQNQFTAALDETCSVDPEFDTEW